MSKRSKKRKKDRHGFYLIESQDDFRTIWGIKKPSPDRPDDFARLFEESLADPAQKAYLKEKVREKERPSTPSAAERIKSYPPPREELDLHHFTAAQAEIAAESFIKKAGARSIRTVRIIVGKGLHSAGKPVIPDVVEQKLTELKRSGLVLAFQWEKRDKRKSGSIIVYLSS